MYPTAYLDYLIYFHVDRDYFECHEVLEEHWKQQPVASRQPHWVGLIQISVGLYHHRRGNNNGAKRMYNKALTSISLHSNTIRHLGLDAPELVRLLKTQIELANNPEEPFSDIDLPIKDPDLLKTCLKRCEQLGKKWIVATSSSVSESLIHKHSKRDRKDVIEERQRQLKLRQRKRQ